MNPQRLVAAVAALAIGFGVTLAGVGFADDETPTDSSGVDQDVGEGEDEDIEQGEQAEQRADVVEEADPAGVDPAAEPLAQQGGPQVATPVESASTSAPEPSEGSTSCEPAVIVVGVDGRVAVLDGEEVRFVIDQFGDETAVLRLSEEPVDSYTELVENSLIVDGFFQDTASGVRFVDCATQDPINENSADGLRNDLLGAASGVASEFAPPGVSFDFPCDSDFIEDFADVAGLSEQLDAARDDGATDVEVVRFYLAARVAGVSAESDRPENDTAFWQESLFEPFFGFRVDTSIGDACELLDDSVNPERDTRSGFFCAVGQLASDDELLNFLSTQVPLESGCTYPPTVDPDSSSGVGLPDEGKN
jgi:hypothetical protein